MIKKHFWVLGEPLGGCYECWESLPLLPGSSPPFMVVFPLFGVGEEDGYELEMETRMRGTIRA